MKPVVAGGAALLLSSTALLAQSSALNDLKAQVFDARMAKQTFANGLKFCNELDGKHFYFQPRNRVLNLDEYRKSLDNLVKERVFNPETRRPWSAEDGDRRWEQVKQSAIQDKANCELVAKLPELEKQVQEMEKKAETPPAKDSAPR